MDACLEACEILGLHASAAVRERASVLSTLPMWTVSIYGRANLERAAALLRLHSIRKREALQAACASYTRRPAVRREELEAMLAEGLTHREMASRLGYKRHGTVQCHLNRFGLATPKRVEHCRCRGCLLGREGFRRLLAAGRSPAEIAETLGYESASAVYYHLNRLGLRAVRRRSAAPKRGLVSG